MRLLGPVVVGVVALAAALVRWWLQGSKNMYTALEKRFYVPDPDLGTRISPEHPVWLGLEVCGIIAAVVAGLLIGAWLIRRLEAKRGRPMTVLRAGSYLVSVALLAIPIAAFASGSRPPGALDTLPTAAAGGPASGSDITGKLDAPGGQYDVVEHAGTSITAQVSAGGETFDARLGGGIRGTWQGDPRDLTAPMVADVGVDAKSVDTGIEARSKHAREGYLQAEKYPRVTMTVDRVLAANQVDANTVGFRAHGTLKLIGKTHSIEITGMLRKPDATARTRLGLSGEILLVQADFDLPIKETAFAADAGDFGGDRIPIHVSLVLRHTSG